MITEIYEDTIYTGHDGTKRYVDEVDDQEVAYYLLPDGDEPGGGRYCSIKKFLKWAKEETPPIDMSIEDFMAKLYGRGKVPT